MLDNTNEYEGDIRCPKGVRDCDPPSLFMYFSSSLATLVLLYLTDMVFYMLAEDTFKDECMQDTPLFLNMLVGYLLASILFVVLYVYFGRPPRNDDTAESYRNRTRKGIIYGFSIGSMVFIPQLFFMSSMELDFNFGMSLLEAVYHVVQITVAGVIIAHIMGTPAREK
jgi:hypothetical protein